MKRLYFMLGLCLLNLSTFAITVTVNATGATGSFKTGYTQAGTGRTDGDMVIDAAGTIKRGYAVFDLSGVVPTGATVTAVNVRFNFTTTTAGLGVVCGIYGFASDLSTVVTTATLFADCATGTAFNTTNWGASTTGAQDLLPFNATGRTFIQANAGSIVSIGFATSSGANVYTITGEGGSVLTQPQLQVTYTCTGVSGVSAAATPNPVCNGSTLTLTGAGTGTTSYSWAGPSSFSSGSMSPTLTASPAAAGIYTFTATSAAGCTTTATTTAVTISAPVPSISGTMSACAAGGTTSLSDVSLGGTWSSAATLVATVGTSGTVTGGTPGTATITYLTTAGCNTTAIVTVNPLPSAITGITLMCVGFSTLLSDPPGTGTWSSSNTLVASVNAGTGAVFGLSGGTATVSYTTAGCAATIPVNVNAAPLPITGTTSACPGTTTTLTDPAGSGTWSSSNGAVATVVSTTGVVNGVAPGATVVTFSNGCGPSVSTPVVINSLPSGIHGLTTICSGSTTTLIDSSALGSWSASPLSIATVGSSTGTVSGVAVGTVFITYTLPTSCAATTVVTVNPAPTPISGAGAVCTGHAILLTESATGGTWSSSNTSLATVSATGIVGGVTFGVVSITYTAGASCFLVHTVTVNPQAPILGTDSVCLGLSTFLTNIVGGGSWSSSAFSVATVIADSGRVIGLTPGTTVITYTSLTTGCQSSVNFRVISFPDPIAGTTKACPGTATNLSDPTAGGLWSSSNNGVATVGSSSGVVTGISADTVTVNYSILPGCTVNTVVTINPLPGFITGSSPVCPQTVDSLRDLSPGGLWTSSTPSIATVIDTSGVVSTLAAGVATIKYTLPTGCFRTKTVSVNPLPVPNVTYNWLTNTFTADIGPQYISYQWYDSIVGLLPGATAPSLAALYTEYYFVVVTDTNGCKGSSALIPYNVSAVGTGNVAVNSGIKIYPNPVSGNLYIESPVNVRAVISSLDGKRELEQVDAKEMDISKLPDAIYLIILYDETGKELMTEKLIKQ